MLNEKQTLRNIRLSDIQKEVLTKVQAAPNEEVAGGEILDGGRNYVGAKDILVRLGLLTFHDNEATITQTGQEVMKKLNLVDDMGQLTDEGNQYAYSEEEQQPNQQQDQQQQQRDQQQQEPEGTTDQGPLSGVGPSFGESISGISLIRSIHEDYKTYKQIKRFKNKR